MGINKGVSGIRISCRNFRERGYSFLKYNSFNLLCKKYLYRIFPIHGSLVKALTAKSLIHPYFCVKSISYS